MPDNAKKSVKDLFSRLNKIQNKIFLPFVIVMVMIGAVIIYVMTDLVSANVETRVNEKLDNDVRLIQEIVSDMERSLSFYAQFIADTEKVAGHMNEARDSRLMLIYLLEFLKENQISSYVGGGSTSSENPELNRLGMLGIRTTGLMANETEGRPLLAIFSVAPIEDHLGSRSVVTVLRKIDRSFLKDISRKTGAYRVQVYYEGQIVESSSGADACDLEVRKILTPDLLKRIVSEDLSYVAEINCDQHSTMMMAAPMSVNFRKEAVMVVFEAMDDLVRAKTNIIITTVAVVGLMLLIVVPIFVLTVSHTVGPIRKLSQASRAVAEGNLDKYVRVKTGDEVGELSASFNKMIDDLRQYREDIERWNQTLEERVAVRTRQLAETQAKLIQSTKLAAVGEFAAGIAHELNNPLAGIYAFLQVFARTLRSRSLKDLTEEEAEEFQENLVHVEREIQRCKSTIGSLLTFARVSERHFILVDLNKIIRDTLAFTRVNLEKAGITVETLYAEDLPPVNGDPNELQQVFLNIVVNARKAMRNGGELFVVTSSVNKNRSVCVSISDTGGGIDEGIIDKIFDPFFTTSEPGEGTGLGLSISYGIINDHRGEILVENRPGEGCTFNVILPVAGGDPDHAASETGDKASELAQKR